jgi:hypothetical protein
MEQHPESGGLSLLFESPPALAGKAPRAAVEREASSGGSKENEEYVPSSEHVFAAPSPPRSQGRARLGRGGALRTNLAPSDTVSFEDLGTRGF